MATINVTVVKARKMRNRDGLFGKNDAYVIVKNSGHSKKTQIKKNAGKEAEWNETFQFVLGKENELHLEVWDYDRIRDDLIGKANIPLGMALQNGFVENWFQVGSGSVYGGEVLLKIQVANSSHQPNNNHGSEPQGNQMNPVQGGYNNGSLSAQGNPPQGGYGAPQGQGYPSQGGYGAPQGQGYPSQGGYGAPQGQGYPAQGGHGASQGQGYPPQGGYGAPQGQGYPPQGNFAPGPQQGYPPR